MDKDLMILIRDVGFPIFVSLMCIFKLDKSLQGIYRELTKINNKLKDDK